MSDPAVCLPKGEKSVDVGLSVDGTWQRKVFLQPYRLIQERFLMFPSFQRAAKDVAVWQRLPSLIQSFMKYGSCHANVI